MSANERADKYKRRRKKQERNKKLGLGFLPSSDSDSDESEFVPPSKRHLVTKDLKGTIPDIKRPISKNTAYGDAVVKQNELKFSSFVEEKRVERKAAEVAAGGLEAEVVHEPVKKQFSLRVAGISRSAIVEYDEEQEGEDNRLPLGHSGRLNFWWAEVGRYFVGLVGWSVS